MVAADDLVERLRRYADEPCGLNASGEWHSLINEAADAIEAVREAAAYMRDQVEWEPCDCGCPAARTPKDARAVTLLRAAAMVNREISGRRDE